MISNTACGWDTGDAWLEAIGRVVAPILLAMKRSESTLITRSLPETKYQDGTVFQAGGPDFAIKHSGVIGFCTTARARAFVTSISCAKFSGKAAGSTQLYPG